VARESNNESLRILISHIRSAWRWKLRREQQMDPGLIIR